MISTVKDILLVEDSENDVELTLEALSAHRLGNRVQVVRDGAEALDFLHGRGAFVARDDGNPVVVLLDLKLPKVDGFEVLREIRATERLKDIPVVMLTSSKEQCDLEEGYNLGVNAYVVKPVDFMEFVVAVKEIGLFWGIINEPPPLQRN